MEHITIKLRAVTPMFMGGANPARAEMRPPSIKGALRFWWRALQPPTEPSDLLMRENRIFGGAGEREGQGGFDPLLSEDSVELEPPGVQYDTGMGYLGYGLASYKRETRRVTTDREAVRPGSLFTLRLVFRDVVHMGDVLGSLWCLIHLGGLGARNRRGFGSIALPHAVDGQPLLNAPPDSVDALAAGLRARFRDLGLSSRTALPRYTALSGRVRLRLLPPKRTWYQAMDEVGTLLSQYRANTFSADGRLMWDFVETGSAPASAPERAVYGLPHNYYFPRTRGKGGVTAQDYPRRGNGEPITRRASPLFIHFHELATGQVVPVLTLIPAEFLPDTARAVVTTGHRRQEVPAPGSLKPIEDFLSSLANSREVTP